jgi:hypothetical protein
MAEDVPDRLESPPPADESGKGGIGADVQSGHNPGSPSTDESSGTARDATGGHAPMDDEPTPPGSRGTPDAFVDAPAHGEDGP